MLFKMDTSCQYVLILVLLLVRVRTQHIERTSIGDLFVKQLTKSAFFSASDAPPEDPVRFVAAEIHCADPPIWLHFTQRDHNQDGFLYGTPREMADSVTLEVVAINQRTFQTAYKFYNITVQPAKYEGGSEMHVVELWVRNYNVEEMLKGKSLSILKKRLKKVWTDMDLLRLINVVSMATITGRTPVPDSPGHEVKDGVVVQIGAPLDFPESLLKISNRCEKNGDLDKRFKPEYDVDWCKMTLVDPAGPDDDVDSLPMVSEPSPWIPNSTGIERQDMLLDFILMVVVPLSIGLLIFIILSIIVFGQRENKKKKMRIIEPQLDRFQNIRSAMMNLRLMSNHRDGPPQLSPVPTPGPSATNTLSRSPGDLSQGPPPYRLPPPYTTQPTEPPREVCNESPHDASDTDELQLMERPTTPETLKVR